MPNPSWCVETDLGADPIISRCSCISEFKWRSAALRLLKQYSKTTARVEAEEEEAEVPQEGGEVKLRIPDACQANLFTIGLSKLAEKIPSNPPVETCGFDFFMSPFISEAEVALCSTSASRVLSNGGAFCGVLYEYTGLWGFKRFLCMSMSSCGASFVRFTCAVKSKFVALF